MAQHFASSVVRFRNPSENCCGTGFLIDRWHVMTCAHVVNAALGRDPMTAARPDQTIQVEIPFAQRSGWIGTATIVGWHPPIAFNLLNAQQPSDLAILRVSSEQSSTIVARIAAGSPKWGLSFRTFGFPVNNGQPADGETMAEDTGGWVHLRPTRDYGHLIKPGFSGAPAFSENDNTVIGMIVAVDGIETRVAYGDPLRRLQIAWPPLAKPYKGLSRFEVADEGLFFGRESIVEDLLNRVKTDAITMIVGPSGGGKSSVVFGGLLPKLNYPWISTTFRPGTQPINNLAWAVAELMVSRESPQDLIRLANELGLDLRERPDKLFTTVRALRRTTSELHLLLVCDQFEELFTLCRDESERIDFLGILSEIASQGTSSRISLVATLRADFMGEVLRGPISQHLDGRYLMLRAMNGHELGRAIRCPAEQFGVSFEDGIDDDILAAVARDAAALPLMEFALERLWAEQEHCKLTRSAYERMGGLEGALAQHADEVVDNLDETASGYARRLLCRLVSLARPGDGEDTKRPQSRQEVGELLWSIAQSLAGQGDGHTAHQPARLLLLYRDEQGREMVDLIHEALIRHWPRLNQWLAEERAFRLVVDDLQRVRIRWESDPTSHRLRGRDLHQALVLREQIAAEYPELNDLIETSDLCERNEKADAEANEIWEPLEFLKGELSGRELEALRRLASADELTRRAFLRRLYELPHRAARFCRLSGPVTRAACGLQRNRAAMIQENVENGFAHESSPDSAAATLFLIAWTGEHDPEALIALEDRRLHFSDNLAMAIGCWASSFASRADPDCASRAIRCVLYAITQTAEESSLNCLERSVDSLLARADASATASILECLPELVTRARASSSLLSLARAAEVLARVCDVGQVRSVLECISKAICVQKDYNTLLVFGSVAKGLIEIGATLDAHLAACALDRLVEILSVVEGPRARYEESEILDPIRFAGAAAAFARFVNEADALINLDHILNILGPQHVLRSAVRVTSNESSRTHSEGWGYILEAVASQIEGDKVGPSFDRILEMFDEINHNIPAINLGRALRALVYRVDQKRVKRLIEYIVVSIDKDPFRLWGPVQTLPGLVARLGAESLKPTLDGALKAMSMTHQHDLSTIIDICEQLVQAGVELTSELGDAALSSLIAGAQTSHRDQYQIRRAVWLLHEAGARLDPIQACNAFDAMLRLIIGEDRSFYFYGDEAEDFASLLANLVDADCAENALKSIMGAFAQTSDAKWRATFGNLAESLLSRMEEGALSRFVDFLLRDISQAIDGSYIHAISPVLCGLASRLTETKLRDSAILIFSGIRETSDYRRIVALGAIGGKFIDLGANVDKDTVKGVLRKLLLAVGESIDVSELRRLWNTVSIFVGQCEDEESHVAVIAALEYPTSGLLGTGSALLDALHRYYERMSWSEGSFWPAVDWFREQHPELGREAPTRPNSSCP